MLLCVNLIAQPKGKTLKRQTLPARAHHGSVPLGVLVALSLCDAGRTQTEQAKLARPYRARREFACHHFRRVARPCRPDSVPTTFSRDEMRSGRGSWRSGTRGSPLGDRVLGQSSSCERGRLSHARCLQAPPSPELGALAGEGVARSPCARVFWGRPRPRQPLPKPSGWRAPPPAALQVLGATSPPLIASLPRPVSSSQSSAIQPFP